MTESQKMPYSDSAPNINATAVQQTFKHLSDRKADFSHKKPARIIDLGTGTGYNVFLLRDLLKKADIPYEFVCVDIEPKLFMIGEDDGVRFVKFDVESKENLGVFDAVIATEVIEHLENPYHFLRTCLDHCAKEGAVVISTPNVASIYSAFKIALTGVPSMFSFEHLHSGYQAHIMPMSPFLMELAMQKIGMERNERYSCVATYSRNVLLLPFAIGSKKTRTIKIPGKNRFLGESGIFTIKRN
jgi:SAM-dependent methyltransferase